MPATKAFILIETEVGRTNEVTADLRQVEGVKSVDSVTGPYDLIAVIEEQGLTNLGELISTRILTTPNISRVVTCLSLV